MPWAQLTRLSLTYDSPQLCFDALAMCTNLVYGYINTMQWTESELSDESHVARSTLLAHLVELKLHSRIWATGAHLGPFLRRFKLPALETLDLSLELCRSVDPDDTFIPWLAPYLTFLLARTPSVQVFTAWVLCRGGGRTRHPLPTCQTSQELELTDTDVDDAFFTGPPLFMAQTPRHWCPSSKTCSWWTSVNTLRRRALGRWSGLAGGPTTSDSRCPPLLLSPG
ncbi:hypothetical protein C8R46DRAFT_500211 [Mycena filopes]|nr:hypothetical protein C8R46DRAFT_500211 [Mycena filopes]